MKERPVGRLDTRALAGCLCAGGYRSPGVASVASDVTATSAVFSSVMSTAPWWGIPVLAGAFAFFGVVLAQGVALWIDRRRRKDEAQRRWDRERQEIYVQFS